MMGLLEEKIRTKAWDEFLSSFNKWLNKSNLLSSEDKHFMYWRMYADKARKKNITNQAIIDFLEEVEELKDRVEELEYLGEAYYNGR